MTLVSVAGVGLGGLAGPSQIPDAVAEDGAAPEIVRYWPPPTNDRSVAPGDVEFKGSVRLDSGAEQQVNVVFAVDVSGSTSSPVLMDCNGDGVVSEQDDYNLDGSVGDVLDCEISAIASLNAELRSFENMGSRINVSIVAFGSTAAAASMTRVGDQFIAAGHYEVDIGPDAEDGDKEVIPAFNTVAASLTRGQVGQYEVKPVSTGTSFDRAVNTSLDVLMGKSGTSWILLISDGQSTVSQATLGRLQSATANDTRARTFAVATGASCSGPLTSIATVGGERCVRVNDPVRLTTGIASTPPSYIDKVEVEYIGQRYEADVDAVGNWSVTVPDVEVGDRTVLVDVFFTNGLPHTCASWKFRVRTQYFEHVALGDSYAAGEGNPPYVGQRNCGTGICMESKENIAFMCHRSQNSWAKKVYDQAYMDYVAGDI
ncbi:MAG: hypothetical protein LBG11_06010, partial [Bifidobacteriaceae bacterium]|nr:hypothetical protein [Bifidobacteriaceae bacterium]